MSAHSIFHGIVRAARRACRTMAWAGVMLVLSACGPKDAVFFAPNPYGGPPIPVDITPPFISNLQPVNGSILNDDLCFMVVEGIGGIGEPVSGLNIPSFRASANGTLLPIRPATAPNVYIIDIGQLQDGQQTVTILVFDLAGNQSTATFAFVRDQTRPTLSFPVPSQTTFNGLSASIPLTGSYSDANDISAATLFVRQRQGTQCALTDPLYPVGTGPGMLSQNTFNLNPASGTFNTSFTAFGPPDTQRPLLVVYCIHIVVSDRAVSKYNTPRPNVTQQAFELVRQWTLPDYGSFAGRVTLNNVQPIAGVTVTLNSGQSTFTGINGLYSFFNLTPGTYTATLSNIPPGVVCNPISKPGVVSAGAVTQVDFNCTQPNFTIALAMSYRHQGPGISFVCVLIIGTAVSARGEEPIALENIAGATWSVQWSGQGTVGSTTRSGALDAMSQALDKQQIDEFGGYTANVSVTYQGVTKQATGNVTVGGTQGTCPP